MEKITADSSIIGTVQMHPEIMGIFMQYGLGCVGCMAASFETIGQGAMAHGIDVDSLLADINDCIAATEGEDAEEVPAAQE